MRRTRLEKRGEVETQVGLSAKIVHTYFLPSNNASTYMIQPQALGPQCQCILKAGNGETGGSGLCINCVGRITTRLHTTGSKVHACFIQYSVQRVQSLLIIGTPPFEKAKLRQPHCLDGPSPLSSERYIASLTKRPQLLPCRVGSQHNEPAS